MPCALEALFSPKAEERLRTVWKALAAAGLPPALESAGGRPHLSLAVATSVDAEPLRAAVEQALVGGGTAGAKSVSPPRAVVLAAAGSFPGPGGIVFLAAVPTPELLAWHEALYGIVRASAKDVRPYYAPKSWLPHVTLTYGLDQADVGRAVDVARSAGLPLVAELAALALVETSPTTVREIWKLPFAGAA